MKRRFLFSVLVAWVVGIGLLHFFTPPEWIFFHDTYRRLSYFPIVLGGIWFGIRGGLVLAVLSSIAFIPHLLLSLGHGIQSYYSELTEIGLYLCAGLVVGMITERERNQRINCQRISAELEHSYERLHRGAAQLLEAEEQLAVAQKLSALGEMSASLAHEIRNPLSSIRGTAEILLDEFPPGHPKREFVEILLKETGHLEATLTNTLDFSRVDQGTTEERDSIGAVLKRQKRLLQGRLDNQGIELEIVESSGMERFFVPVARISQVVLNLLMNGIEVLSEAQPVTGGRLRVGFREVEGGGRIDFEDNGPGVENGLKEKIFQPFVSGKQGGTGLGLAISRRIATRYGGELTVGSSELGGGCFSLVLPRPGGEG